MLKKSIVKMSAFKSSIASSSVLNPKDGMRSKGGAAGLLLTALIDAFSILVIFLLMNFSTTGDILFIEKGMELPKASQAELVEVSPIIKVDNGELFLDGQLTSANDMTAGLINLRKKWQEAHTESEPLNALTIQADRRVTYEVLNQVVVAAAQAGFSDLKFAALIK